MTYIHSMMSAMVISLILAAMPTEASALDDDQSKGDRVTIFRHVPLKLDRNLSEGAPREGYVLRREGRMAEAVVELPPAPADQRDARRITATVDVMPTLVEVDEGYRAGDPWPRIGSVAVLAPDAAGNIVDVEIMRFITGFGGTTTYTEDLTALAPLLHGRTIVRVMINTYSDPAWEVTLTLRYEQGPGFRRPALAMSVFNEPHVTVEESVLRATVTIPEGLHRPRLRILTTGHATDGRGGDEFVPRTHVLRIDGREVARWQPWAEHGNSLRQLNPTSGRAEIDGRELWSSDFDRAGWHPGLLVQPLMIPTALLTPGEHEIELEIQDIRPPDPDDELQEHGYWRVSLMIVADEPWPGRAGVRRGGRESE